MTKSDFMNDLEELLKDLPFEEKEAAIKYYDDYFEDAGHENIDHVLEELGSPERVAAIIKYNISGTNLEDSDKIIYTENGYKDTTVEENHYEVVKNGYEKTVDDNGKEDSQNYEETIIDDKNTFNKNNSKNVNNSKSASNNTSKIILIIILCIIAIPIGAPILGTAFGLIIGAIGTLFGLYIALIAVTGSLIISGIVLFVTGVIQLFLTPTSGILMCGIGLLLLGLGILALMLTFFISTRIIPALVRGIVDLCKMPFKKGGATQ